MKPSQLIVPLVLIITLLGLLHYFVFAMSTMSFPEPSLALQIFFIVMWLLGPASLLLNMSPLKAKLLPLIMVGYVWLGTFMIAIFFSTLQFLSMLAGFNPPSWWILIATPIIALWSLRINFTGPQVVKHSLPGPEFMKDMKIVQISDLHVGQSILREKWLSDVVDKVLKLEPDAVMVTGDLADGKFNSTVPMLKPLQRIQCPKFYVTGNHEYITGGDWETELKKLGFQVLHNENAVLKRANGNLLIAGVPDRGVSRFRKGLQSLPDKALNTSVDVGYRILLAHEPSSVFDIKNEKCDLLLAGHTHGGQIFPFGIFVRLQQPVSWGFKKINNVNVFAHMGTGFWGPPMRWFTRCEIVEFSWEA